MKQQEIDKMFQILDRKVEKYHSFKNRNDYLVGKPCVDNAVSSCQNIVFSLAESLWEMGFITFEKCCEYWSKVDFTDEYNAECKFTNCEANINGICKYYIKENKNNEN